MRTRIKICGLTREADVAAAVEGGADAVGFICYEGSPRHVARPRLRELASHVPPLVTPVLVFVNAAPQVVEAALQAVPNALLQFQGDEGEAACSRYARPYVRAIRLAPGVDLLDCERHFFSASALLVDAPSAQYGGSGQLADWSRVPVMRGKPLALAGGLTAANVGDAIRQLGPYAVDVSSGVEDAPGIKSSTRIFQFTAAVRAADEAQAAQA
jgi:phosphoribosylanthranilate isomerase